MTIFRASEESLKIYRVIVLFHDLNAYFVVDHATTICSFV